MQQNIDIKWRGKVTQYQQPVFETRERRPRYPVMIVPRNNWSPSWHEETMNDLTILLTKQELLVKNSAKMQKTILMDSETLLRKVFSGLVQSDTEENRPFS